MEPIRIRPYREDDEPDVIALWNAELAESTARNDARADIRTKLDLQRDLFLVGTLEGRLVATAMGGFDGHRGWVYYLAVAADQRRRGFGAALMREVERRLRELGCAKLNLQVRGSNREVVRFYEKLGYAVEDNVGMGRRLDRAD